jgi:hypothetical protein
MGWERLAFLVRKTPITNEMEGGESKNPIKNDEPILRMRRREIWDE